MKKNSIVLLHFSLRSLFVMTIVGISALSFSFAASVEIDGFIQALDTAVAKRQTSTQKIHFLNTVNNLLDTPKFQASEYKFLFDYLSDYASYKIQTLSIQSSPIPNTKHSLDQNYFSVPAINAQRLRDTVLSRHNKERNLLGLPHYIYHSELERSANIRTDMLKTEERTVNTHVRKPTDGYYSFNSISQRFRELGIGFSGDTFSESVGWGYYKCDKADCTDELLKSLRTTWDFFMGEKERLGTHYKAISSKSFSTIGIGISIDPTKKRYYFVIHYGADLLE